MKQRRCRFQNCQARSVLLLQCISVPEVWISVIHRHTHRFPVELLFHGLIFNSETTLERCQRSFPAQQFRLQQMVSRKHEKGSFLLHLVPSTANCIVYGGFTRILCVLDAPYTPNTECDCLLMVDCICGEFIVRIIQSIFSWFFPSDERFVFDCSACY